MKRCFKCKAKKPLRMFYRHQKMRDGYLGKCKNCTKKDVRDNYIKNIDKYRIYEKKRFNDPKRKSDILKYQINRRKKFPGKYKARYAVSSAIRDGRLKKLPCIYCGNKKSQAHHTDYRKKLDVKWVCFTCHRHHEHGQMNHVLQA